MSRLHEETQYEKKKKRRVPRSGKSVKDNSHSYSENPTELNYFSFSQTQASDAFRRICSDSGLDFLKVLKPLRFLTQCCD